MHEMGVAESIVETALSARGEREGRITTVCVEVGSLSAVNVQSLEFWMDLTLQKKGMEAAEVKIERVPATVKCDCGNRYEAKDMFSGCPECGSLIREVLAGMNVNVKYIEVEDD